MTIPRRGSGMRTRRGSVDGTARVRKLSPSRWAIALTLVACSSGGSDLAATDDAAKGPNGTEASAAEAAAVARAGADWEPLAKSTSPCGRYTLRLEHAEWRDEPGSRPQLSLQFALRTNETDVLLAGGGRVTDLVPPDGAEFREADLKGFCVSGADAGSLAFHGLEVYRRDERLKRLRVEARVLRVFSWTTYEISCTGPDDRAEFLCAPFSVSLSGDAGLPAVCWVGACVREGWRDLPAHRRDLFGALGHDWVAGSAVLTDARGRRLVSYGSNFTGGSTSSFYGPELPGAASPEASQPTIAWPVQGTIRLPERYVVELVPFEFTDCALSASDPGGGR